MNIPRKGQQVDFPSPLRYRNGRRSSWRVLALFLVPIAFALLTAFSLYITLEPLVGNQVGLAMLLVGDNAMAETETRDLLNLLEPAKTGRPVAWVALPDQTELSTSNETDTDESLFIKRSEIEVPATGDLYANITISGTKIDAPVFWGDSENELNKGVGTFRGAWLPGFGRTVIMAGHRNTDFKDLSSVEVGAVITVRTHYETYTYKVVRTDVYHMDDTDSYDLLRDDENIILYTCYPFDFIGAARERFFVYGEPLTGTPVARYK